MKMTMRITAADLVRALTLRVHALADDVETASKTGAAATVRDAGEANSAKGTRQ